MANFLVRRMYQLTLALTLCAPGLLADTFRLPGGEKPFGETPVFTRPHRAPNNGVLGIHAIVYEFQTTSHQNQPLNSAEIQVLSRTPRGGNSDRGNRKDRHTDYMAAVYLATQMIGIDSSTAFGKLQARVVNTALWSVFYRSYDHAFTPPNSGPRYAAQAQTGRGNHGVPSVNIWRPSPKDPPGGPKPVRVPEPSLASLLAFNALVLTILGLYLRRRRVGFVD